MTTAKYNFIFILPNSIRDIPIPFDDFKKPLDDEGNETGWYTYNEYMQLPNNKAIVTPSKTHTLLSRNITSITFKDEFQGYLNQVAPDIQLMSSVQLDKWNDENQDNYLWVVTTDKSKPAYNFDAFRENSKLYEE